VGGVKESLRHANSRLASEKTVAAAARLTLPNAVVSREKRNVEAKVVPMIRLEEWDERGWDKRRSLDVPIRPQAGGLVKCRWLIPRCRRVAQLVRALP
jgi:hypothetical protein